MHFRSLESRIGSARYFHFADNMDEKIKTAFEFARDTTNQLITLATGIIAIEITFAHDFVKSVAPEARRYALFSWLAFLLSVFFGVWTLLALTGTLEPKQPTVAISIRGRNIRIPSALQIILFLIGLALTITFAAKAG